MRAINRISRKRCSLLAVSLKIPLNLDEHIVIEFFGFDPCQIVIHSVVQALAHHFIVQAAAGARYVNVELAPVSV